MIFFLIYLEKGLIIFRLIYLFIILFSYDMNISIGDQAKY